MFACYLKHELQNRRTHTEVQRVDGVQVDPVESGLLDGRQLEMR